MNVDGVIIAAVFEGDITNFGELRTDDIEFRGNSKECAVVADLVAMAQGYRSFFFRAAADDYRAFQDQNHFAIQYTYIRIMLIRTRRGNKFDFATNICSYKDYQIQEVVVGMKETNLSER